MWVLRYLEPSLKACLAVPLWGSGVGLLATVSVKVSIAAELALPTYALEYRWLTPR